MKNFLVKVWARLALPVELIVAHFAVSVLALSGLALIELIVKIMGIREKIVPGTKTPLEDWILDLELFAAAAIILLGTLEALVLLFLGIILDCATKIREIGKAWRS